MPPFGHFSLIRFAKKCGAGRVSVPRSAASAAADRASTHNLKMMPPSTAASFLLSHRHSSNRHSTDRMAAARGDSMERLSRSSAGAALGRSSLLSSQPDQPIAASGQRDQLPVRLCDDVQGSCHCRAGRLAGVDDQPPGRPLLLRAEGLRQLNQATHEYKEEIKVGYNLQPQGRADVDLGAVAATALLSIRRYFGMFTPHTSANGIHAPRRADLARDRARRTVCSAPSSCSSSRTCRPAWCG